MAAIVALTEDFEGAAAGVAIGTGNSVFDSITGTTTVAPRFSAPAIQGSLSGRVQAGDGTTAQTSALRADVVAPSGLWLSVYLCVADRPDTNTSVINFYANNTVVANFRLMSDGTIQLRNGTAQVFLSTETLAVNQWHRVAIRCVPNNASGLRLRVYSGADLHGGIATIDSGAQASTIAGPVDNVRLGAVTGDTGMTVFFDRMRADDSVEPSSFTGVAPGTAPPPPPVGLNIDEDFEGGAAGDLISTDNTVFTSIFSTATTAPRFHASGVIGKAMRVVAGPSTTAQQSTLRVNAAPDGNAMWVGLYLWLEKLPVAVTSVVNIYAGDTVIANFRVFPDGLPQLRNGTSAVWTGSIPLATGQWHRVSVWCKPGDAAGLRARVYSGAQLHATGSTMDSGGKASTLTATIDNIRVGVVTGDTDFALRVDRLRGSATTEPPPAPITPPVTVSAGPDQIARPGSIVTLTATTSDDSPATWTAPAGVTLLAGSGSVRQFRAPSTTAGGTYTFTAATGAVSDTMTVTVYPHTEWRVSSNLTRLPIVASLPVGQSFLLGYVKPGIDRAGLPRNIIGTFMNRDSWAGLSTGDYMYATTNAGNEYPIWVVNNRGLAADVATPLIPHNSVTGGEHNAAGRQNATTGWNALLDSAASGARDDVYTQMGIRLAQLGPKVVYSRLWWEYNQYATDINPAKFVAAWRRAVPLIRAGFESAARPGQALRVVLCYMASNDARLAEFYPGRDFVDVIAADIYAGLFSSTNPTGAQVRTYVTTALAQLVANGNAYGKPVALGEYGLSPVGTTAGTYTRGTGDDPTTLQVFLDWMTANRVIVTHAVYFDITSGAGLSLDATPNALAVIKAFYSSVTGLAPPPDRPPDLLPLTITPDPPTLLPAEQTRQQVTFQTPPNVEVSRTTRVRKKPAPGATPDPWLPTNPTIVKRIGTHTATFGGNLDGGLLTPATTHEGWLNLQAPGHEDVTRIIEFTTASATSTVTFDRTGYPSGWGQWPRLWWLQPGSTFTPPAGERVVRDRRVLLQPGEKVRIVCPEVWRNPNAVREVVGGSWVLQGCLTRWTTYQGANLSDGEPPVVGYDRTFGPEPAWTNLFLKVVGNPNAPFSGEFRAIEGAGVLPSDVDGKIYCWESINYDGKQDSNDTLVIRGFRLADAARAQGGSWIEYNSPTATDPNRTGHSGGDALIQPWNGPTHLDVSDVVVVTSYQAFFGQMDTFFGGGTADHTSQKWRRVEIIEDRGAPGRVGSGIPGTAPWWDATRGKSGVTRTFGTGADGVYVNGLPGKTRNQLIRDADIYTHDDPIVVGPAPRDFKPLADLVPYDPADPRWL